MPTTPATLTPKPAETRIVLDNVTWAAFEALLAAEGPDRGRMAYEEGTLEIMSPSSEHQKLKSRMSRLISIYTEELGIDVEAMGSTTLKREMKRRGVEPDESFYIQNEIYIRGKSDLELGRDPPPDLVIEIQITRSALDKLGIYSAMGVPEVWLWEGDALKIHWLGDDGRYAEMDCSKALPGLPLAELLRFLGRAKEMSTTRLANEFRAWLRESRGKGA